MILRTARHVPRRIWISLAVPGRLMRSLVAEDRKRRRASAPGRDREDLRGLFSRASSPRRQCFSLRPGGYALGLICTDSGMKYQGPPRAFARSNPGLSAAGQVRIPGC